MQAGWQPDGRTCMPYTYIYTKYLETPSILLLLLLSASAIVCRTINFSHYNAVQKSLLLLLEVSGATLGSRGFNLPSFSIVVFFVVVAVVGIIVCYIIYVSILYTRAYIRIYVLQTEHVVFHCNSFPR